MLYRKSTASFHAEVQSLTYLTGQRQISGIRTITGAFYELNSKQNQPHGVSRGSYITNGKNLRTARKLWKNISLVTAIRMNQPCWVFSELLTKKVYKRYANFFSKKM